MVIIRREIKTGVRCMLRPRIAIVGKRSTRQKFPTAGTQPGSSATLAFGL